MTRFLIITLIASAVLAQAPSDGHDPISPIRRIQRDRSPAPPPPDPRPESAFRSIDGSQNNRDAPLMGAANTNLLRLTDAEYADGRAAMAGDQRPNPRALSNALCAREDDIQASQAISSFLWQWGQFVDHDIDLTDGADPPEPANIVIPTGDPWFDPESTGQMTMAFNRSAYDPESESYERQQINEITAWIDGSNVYGSDPERAKALRAMDGSGRLKTSAGNLLPFNEVGLANAGGPDSSLFLAGDVRANEQVGLLAMHTLFVREHNRQAEEIARREPSLDGEQIYQKARQMVGAMIQHITYTEFLPVLLGDMVPRPYRGYRPEIDASIANEFSTAAYRFGHSALNDTILRLDSRNREDASGHLPLRDAFFAPHRLQESGIDPILRGLAAQVCQAVDLYVIDDVRNFLFGAPGSGGFDLASLNIQRGRDHGLGSYNQVRRDLGMRPARDFRDIAGNPEIADKLASIYDAVEQVDLWVGGLAERPVPGAMLGETFTLIIRDQFEALRDGDRYWYERVLSHQELRDVRRTRLADIIRRNTDIGSEMDPDVFHTR